jgi:hypothetical protein
MPSAAASAPRNTSDWVMPSRASMRRQRGSQAAQVDGEVLAGDK